MSDVHIVDERTADERDRTFLPGMGKAWLMPIYDVFSRALGVAQLHRRGVGVAGVRPGQAVLDVGCGTGNLALTLLEATPRARVTGIDPDGGALRRAARKARRRRVPLTLTQGYADRLPADDGSFDHVISALALHHLADEDRTAFAHEAFRVLRPGGTVTIVDFAGPAPGEQDAGHGHDHDHDHGDDHDHGHGHGHGPLQAVRGLRRLLRAKGEEGPVVARSVSDGLVELLSGAGFRRRPGGRSRGPLVRPRQHSAGHARGCGRAVARRRGVVAGRRAERNTRAAMQNTRGRVQNTRC
ncbi:MULTISPECIES: class I SAM-dependent methyltransferase [Prauserella salsuginis group]|uniref:Class I SAM-dependent methyltransferase n=1 Tax=Prauserella salsuginis TaxID=387889 RepID=A0ABW6GB70_9PSEU|nr:MULTISPECIES: class I SAM-dependent methyltransferase [Prauserella salsuginis group]MCR3719022.1 Methyltransferase domain-containing protein [Prauserella flava]MCR3733592.1 Methyltransferase domain-containing protein [Prauserella salsuginis]